MNALLMIAFTTGILSGVWGWLAITFGLIGWAGFLGYAICFSSPISGLRGLSITALTCCTGVFWAEVILLGNALTPGWSFMGYLLTGAVAFLMCIQSLYQWLAFIPGTFIGAGATFAAQGNWQLVLLSLLLGLLFGYAMKISGLWLMQKHQLRNLLREQSKAIEIARTTHSRSEGS
ncbi:DUF1097 domain-containing protein [Rahnella sp. SAP-1]|uniref:DUF1097 domain-containing protein n=1 Tax=Rouxiella aceris TaxID=2703884 RepID=A0A848MJX8_9GAMM|nr:DUF1097 domain-containing protein [Rouxiella aceris]NMP27262.1 DUF1097 domain-containing protein [Rouxiella aceris]